MLCLMSIPESFYRIIDKGDDNNIMFLNGSSADDRSKCFLCKVCRSYLKKGTIPPKAVLNCLETVQVPENVRLRSYLEEALV